MLAHGRNEPKWCKCGRHAYWWISDSEVRVFDARQPEWLQKVTDEHFASHWNTESRAFILGLMNDILWTKGDVLERDDYERMWSTAPETAQFRWKRSVIVRIRPGHSNDTAYAREVAAHG